MARKETEGKASTKEEADEKGLREKKEELKRLPTTSPGSKSRSTGRRAKKKTPSQKSGDVRSFRSFKDEKPDHTKEVVSSPAYHTESPMKDVVPLGNLKINISRFKLSSEPAMREVFSTPAYLKDSASREQTKEQLSTYGNSWIGAIPSCQEFSQLEEQVAKLPSFHGFVCHEDLGVLLKRTGDWLIRTSVPPPKEDKRKAGKSKEKTSKSKEKTSKPVKTNKNFVISVNAKDKSICPTFTSLRHMIIRNGENKIWVENSRKFSTVAELVAFYQKNPGNYKETEFQLLCAIPLCPWEFQHEDVELTERRLGEGAFGDVRVGRLKSKDAKRTVVEVAVKMLKNTQDSVTREQVTELLHEARVMRILDHPNVLWSHGIAVLREPLYLMSELCANGALREYLKENQKSITLAEKLNFVVGSAKGVEFLHASRIIHRDLAVRNILLTDDKTPKVSDFGLAKLTERYEMKEPCKIPVRYLAPETLENFVFTPKTDVFSFGCVIWEIYENGLQPHDGKNAKTIRAQVKKQDFLRLAPAAPEALRKLVTDRIFVADPENRCSMTTIVQCVEKLVAK